jgi:DNA-directed RNA polymerase subunit E'/Rpb7
MDINTNLKNDVHTNLKKEGYKKKDMGVYMNNLLTRKIHVPFINIGKNIKDTLETIIKLQIEGKCTIEGFIKPNSTKVLSYSSGLLVENMVMFEVVFECLVCCPVEGMRIKCNVKNMTQAGIRALINTESDVSPIVVYVSRDHHYNNNYFNSIKENDDIIIRVIGQRYELNDPQVSIIGELIEAKNEIIKNNMQTKKKPKLVIT